jgi:peptidoglycan hydrolase-like protein with peptidoglycan-binding domain
MESFKIGLTRSFFCLAAALMLVLAPFSARADSYGDKTVFNIDKTYDAAGRAKTLAALVWAGDKIYFYVDEPWWEGLDSAGQAKYNLAFQNLDAEFSKNIYPKLTSVFGSDVNPAVDRGGKITLLVHPMVKDAGGYINTGDGYSRYQSPASNEREMIYFNTRFIDAPLAKAYLAHEFTHLITFNQKDRLRNAMDDVWLNEARADYSSTILGYDSPFGGSNFDQRTRSFSADPSKSLVEWQNKPANYGAAHLFMQYLVDRFGIDIIADSMQTEQTGIGAIEYALKKNGFDVGFAQVFRDWLVALAANDCRLGGQYCYKYAGLRGFVITPKINYLPNSDQVSLSVMYNTNFFSGNWQKIVGGNGALRLDFSADPGAKFQVPYLLCYAGGGECQLGDLEVAGDGQSVLNLPDFGRQYASLTLMPFAAGKTYGFDDSIGNQQSYTFKISISPKSVSGQNSGNSEANIQALLLQIETLKNEIARIQAILAARAAATKPAGGYLCKSIAADLYFGVENHSQVSCLQQVLKSQGSAVYPSGAVTGRFSIDTREAVARFQEKYASEILAPLGLKSGTGYVGSATRQKLNALMAH